MPRGDKVKPSAAHLRAAASVWPTRPQPITFRVFIGEQGTRAKPLRTMKAQTLGGGPASCQMTLPVNLQHFRDSAANTARSQPTMRKMQPASSRRARNGARPPVGVRTSEGDAAERLLGIVSAPIRHERFSEQVYDSLFHSIMSGKLDPGSRLPPELELAAMFGVSRPVVRQALDRLRREELIESIRGSGTFVRAHPQPMPGRRLSTHLLAARSVGSGTLAPYLRSNQSPPCAPG